MLPRKISWLLLPLLSCMCCANPCQPIHCWKQISLQLAHANASNYDGMINQSGLFLRNQLNSSRLSVWWKQRPMLLQQIWHLVITRWIVFHVPLEQEWIALRSLWWECDAEIRKQTVSETADSSGTKQNPPRSPTTGRSSSSPWQRHLRSSRNIRTPSVLGWQVCLYLSIHDGAMKGAVQLREKKQ